MAKLEAPSWKNKKSRTICLEKGVGEQGLVTFSIKILSCGYFFNSVTCLAPPFIMRNGGQELLAPRSQTSIWKYWIVLFFFEHARVVWVKIVILRQIIPAFWLVCTYDLSEDRCIDLTLLFQLCFILDETFWWGCIYMIGNNG